MTQNLVWQAKARFSKAALQEQAPSIHEDIINAMFAICDEAEENIESQFDDTSVRERPFRDSAHIRLITQELLKYAIEDEGIDIRDEASAIADAFQSYFERGKLEKIYRVYNRIIHKEPIAVRKVELRSPSWEVRVKASMPIDPRQQIPVSSASYPIVPILEETLADFRLAAPLADAYARAVEILSHRNSPEALCFIEKAIGPVGALGLFGALVERTNLHAFVFRQRYFRKRGRLSGHVPQRGAQVILVYDLVVSGYGLRTAAKNLEESFGIHVIGAVVLFNYGNSDSIKFEADDREYEFPVISIFHYSEVESEILQIHKGNVSFTKNIKPAFEEREQRERSLLDARVPPESHQKAEGAVGMSPDEKPAFFEALRSLDCKGSPITGDMSLDEFLESRKISYERLSPIGQRALADPDFAREVLVKIGLLAEEKK